MIIIKTLCLQTFVQTALITIATGTFITLRDPNFTGQDERLSSQLAQRVDPAIDLATGYATNATLFLPDTAPLGTAELNSSSKNFSDFLGQFLESGRRQQDVYTTNFHIQVKILDVMRQSIYQARSRVQVLERIVRKYQKDERFRIAYIFANLDQWEKEIRGIYQAAQYYMNIFPVQKHIYYYEHCLRRQVDVTYSVQFLYVLHNKFMENYKVLLKDKKGVK